MTIPSASRPLFIAVILAAASCARRADIAKLETAEAADKALAAANAAQRKGDYAKASDLFEAVTVAHPSNALAHLQTAIIMQDWAGDDASAIHHLRAYLRLVPDSDKTEMASERLRLAKQRLEGEKFRPDAAAAPRNTRDAELQAAAAALDRARNDVVEIMGRVLKQEEEIKRYQAEIKRLTNRLDVLGETNPQYSPGGSLTDEVKNNGLDALPFRPDSAPDKIKKLIEKEFFTYEVQPGDTVWSIAQDWYLDGSRAAEILEANPGLTGILKPHTVIRIPK